MARLGLSTLALLLACISHAPAADSDIAPRGKLRAVYIASNIAQAVQDRATGVVSGPSADLTRELARRLGIPGEITPVANPEAVIDAVNTGAADIGFVAFANSRAGRAEFSQTYMLVQQTFLVLDNSPIRSVADADAAGRKVAGVRTDSTTAFIKRNFKNATVLEVENDHVAIKRMLFAKEIDAFAANRARQVTLAAETPGTRVLPDSLLRIPQSIIVPMAMPRLNAPYKTSIERNRVIGVDVAPTGSLRPTAP
jgi:polar amino acid transport system substrate-binding protein